MFDLTPSIRQRFFDSNGIPLAGGQLYSYQAGTVTPQATYTDSTGSTPNTNPVVLDASGYANVWMGNGNYKFVLADVSNNIQWTVDNVQSVTQQIAEAINIAGALAVTANLSDVSNKPTALVNLNIAPFSYLTRFTVTNGQSATNLAGEAYDGTVYSSVVYEYEIIQGTTIFGSGSFVLQYLNGTWQLIKRGDFDNGTPHGVTFSLTQATTIGQLQAAESGLADGTIKLKKHYFFT